MRQRTWLAARRVPVYFVLLIALVATGSCASPAVVPPPSATGDDEAVVGPGLLWVFRGSDLTVLSRSTRQAVASTCPRVLLSVDLPRSSSRPSCRSETLPTEHVAGSVRPNRSPRSSVRGHENVPTGGQI